MKIKIFKSAELPLAALAATVSMLLAQFCSYLFSGYSLSVRVIAAGIGAGVGLWLVRKFWRGHRPKQ